MVVLLKTALALAVKAGREDQVDRIERLAQRYFGRGDEETAEREG